MRLGADVQALRRLGSEMSSAADNLAESRRRIGVVLERTWWRGPAFQQFQREWTAVHGPHLRSVERLLHDAGSALASQAAQQEVASDAAGNRFRSAGAGIGPGVDDGTSAGTRPDSDTDPGRMTGTGAGIEGDAAAGIGDEDIKTGLFASMFASSRDDIRARIEVLRKAEQAELAERSKWYRLGGLLWRNDRLEAIRRTAQHYNGLTGPDRQILLLGPGRIAEVFGDMDSASRVGIWVPGVGTDLSAFEKPDSLTANRVWDGDPDLAMVEWLGYDPPDRIPQAAIELGHGARRAGDDLNEFVSQIKDLTGRDGERRSILIGGHSYGAVVAASAAAAGTGANGVVLAGSPGVPVEHASKFLFDGSEPGRAENVAVVGNRFDPVALGHLADEAINAAASLVLAPLPLSSGFQLLGNAPCNGNTPTWWSQMSYDPNTEDFGATRLPSNETRLGGAATGSNHRYAEPGSTSLQSLKSAFRR